MKYLSILLFLIIHTSCIGGQSINSHTFDANLADDGGCVDQSKISLCDSIEIIISQCVDCHQNTHSDWINYDTNEKWIASGKIVRGSPDLSPLITWLSNAGGNMPKGKSAISDEDYQTLREWITDM